MASLRKKNNCHNWFACFVLPDGRRVQRSTGTSSKKEALKMATHFEAAAKKVRTTRQAHRVVRDIYAEITGGDTLKTQTFSSYLADWYARKEKEIEKVSLSAYKSKLDRLASFLGTKADGDISFISGKDILAFRAEEAKRVSPRTVNNAIKSIRVFFEDARRDGLIAENPATDVRVLKAENVAPRQMFSLDQIKAILAVCDDEWKSMVTFGLYTGQRLQDIATLTWASIDLTAKETRFTTSKTGRTVGIPMADALVAHISGLESSDDPYAPVHPRAAALVEAAGKSGTLSNQFADILAAAGLRKKKTHDKSGDGRSGRRELSPLSYHSLRVTATTLMKNAGISSAIVEDIIGHDSSEISRLYTRIDSKAKKSAIDMLPNIFEP
jgi:integrase